MTKVHWMSTGGWQSFGEPSELSSGPHSSAHGNKRRVSHLSGRVVSTCQSRRRSAAGTIALAFHGKRPSSCRFQAENRVPSIGPVSAWVAPNAVFPDS